MIQLSRRVIARYVCDRLLAGDNPKSVARRALAELEQTGRRNQWGMLLDDIAYELERRGLLTQAKVISAHELSSGLRQKLERFIRELSGTADSAVQFSTNDEVIGGIRIESATRTIDTTIQRQLLTLRKA